MPTIIEEIHVGDVGTAIIATFYKSDGTVRDISSPTVLQFIFVLPNDDILTKTATLVSDGTNGEAQYVTVADDLSLPGLWQMEGYIEKSGLKHHTNIVKFQVYPNLN